MKVVFLIAGFGFGNASRQLAIIQELRQADPNLMITVFSWGRGYEFLQDEAKNSGFELKSLAASSKRWGGSFKFSFLMATLNYILRYPVNLISLVKFNRKNQPDIVIFDSDYHIPAFLFSKVRRISVNQAPNIFAKSKRYSWAFIMTKGFLISYLVEVVDYWFQTAFAQYILTPSMAISKVNGTQKAIPIPLIVRREFLENTPLMSKSLSVKPALLLGGSGVDTAALRSWAEKSGATVFERNKDTTRKSLAAELQEYRPLVVQGGLSSISEGLALQKYMLVVPVAKHWEQFINAQEVESLELGKVATPDELDERLKEFAQPMPFMSDRQTDCTGAKAVSNFILRELR